MPDVFNIYFDVEEKNNDSTVPVSAEVINKTDKLVSEQLKKDIKKIVSTAKKRKAKRTTDKERPEGAEQELNTFERYLSHPD